MSKPMRVAILGGGMGGLTAAWNLSKRPDLYDVTLYQRGWRLGGKGASGAAIIPNDWRIEEHGLHILMGFYDNAFGTLRQCYDEVNAAHAWPPRDLPAFDDALIGQKAIWVAEERNGDWEFWENSFSLLTSFDKEATTSFQHGFDQLGMLVDHFRTEVARLTGDPTPLSPTTDALERNLKSMPDDDPVTQGKTAEELRKVFETAWAQAETSRLEPLWTGSYRLRQAIAVLYLATMIPVRLYEHGVLKKPYDFSLIDHLDFQPWLKGTDPKANARGNLTWNSPYVRALYDLCFSLHRSLAAGVGCVHLKEILFGWKDEVLFKMNGGMGDVVFAPLQIALAKRRNVKIRYFHRVTKLELDGTKRFVQRITMERQVAGLQDYDPLAISAADQLPSWPNEPLYERMTQAYRDARDQAKKMPHDFETEFESPFADKQNPLVLEYGAQQDGFDAVVLAISVGGLKTLCGPLKSNAAFARMLDDAVTVPTQAFQLWLKRKTEGSGSLKWTEGRAMAGYAEPFSSCTDMNQTLGHEVWPSAQPKTVAYVCGSFLNAPTDKEAAVKQVARDARSWLDENAWRLVPGAAEERNGFDWKELIDPDRGFYARANVDPSDQYVLSEHLKVKSRLAPGASGFDNLFLAGDWVKNPLNSGCLESATFGGLLAAEAIMKGPGMSMPSYVETDGDWSIRPPGVLAQCQMNIFLVDANEKELQKHCSRLVDLPSGQKVQIDALAPGFVMLVFVDIPRGYSTAQPELGYQPEYDMSIFVPVTLKVDGKSQGLAAIAPYLVVNNVAGLITGREVIGFAKNHGDLHFDAGQSSFKVYSSVLAKFGADQPVTRGLVAKLSADGPTAVVYEATAAAAAIDQDAAMDKLLEAAAKALGAKLPKIRFGEVPLVFLKQFRDAVDPRLACHQEIVMAKSKISNVTKVRIRTGKFKLELPAYAKPTIAKTLGIAATPKVLGVSFELHLDFSLPTGTSLWKAT